MLVHRAVLVLLLLFLGCTSTEAGEVNCNSCVPPAGRLGYVWFQLKSGNGSSFTCDLDRQTITVPDIANGQAGFRPDGELGAIRYNVGGVVKQIMLTGGAICTLRFPD
jgi:hypothetical protein